MGIISNSNMHGFASNSAKITSGGIRSVVQLVILRHIEKVIDLGIPVQDFFDLIIGTRYVFMFRLSPGSEF